MVHAEAAQEQENPFFFFPGSSDGRSEKYQKIGHSPLPQDVVDHDDAPNPHLRRSGGKNYYY